MKLIGIVTALAFSITGIAQEAGKYAATITPESLFEKLSFIAGPETEGRASGTKGQRVAAAYIEHKFKMAGLLPGTPAGYQMVFPIYHDTLFDLSLKVNNEALVVQRDFAMNFNSVPSMYTEIKEMVFVSYGISDSLRDDYSGHNVKDKWVLVLEGLPEQKGKTLTARQVMMAYQAKARAAGRKGAKGIFVVSNSFPWDTPPQVTGGNYVKKRDAGLPMFYISPKVAGNILAVQADSLSDLVNISPGVYTTKIESYVHKRAIRLASTNVLGIMPGTDKKDEYIVLTAHYDHLGMHNGVIHPGADDDGSGTVAIIQLAEAFAKAKAEGKGPRRSIIFMAVSGEEMGLLGSAFYSDHPVYPMQKTSVNLNIDMIGRVTPNYGADSLNYVYLIGDDRLSSELAPLSDSANKAVGLQLDRKFNGNDPSRYYERSDHYNFAKMGVPIIFYFNGTHADYHRATDTIDKINFNLMSRRAQLVFYTAWLMANNNNMLKRDIPMR